MPEQEYMTTDYASGIPGIGKLPKGITAALFPKVDFTACLDIGEGHGQRWIMRVYSPDQADLDAIAATPGCVKLPDAGQDFKTKFNIRLGTSLTKSQIYALTAVGRMARS